MASPHPNGKRSEAHFVGQRNRECRDSRGYFVEALQDALNNLPAGPPTISIKGPTPEVPVEGLIHCTFGPIPEDDP